MKGIHIQQSLREAKWMRVFVPLVVLTLYFVSFRFFLSWLLHGYDTNVNAEFVSGAWKLSLLAAGLYLFFLVLFKLYVIFKLERYFFALDLPKEKSLSKQRKGSKPGFKNRIEKFDFILVLLPLAPVVQYILNNQDILSPLGSLYVLAVFAAFSLLFIIVIPALLGIVGSTKTLMILGLAFTFTITNMASLSADFHWYERGMLELQLILFGGLFLVGWGLYTLIGRKFLYLIVAVFFVANIAIQLLPEDTAETAPISTQTANRLVELAGSKEPLSTPNIYLLVYDAYVVNETMLGYGIDNGAQEEYLETMGFKIYPHTYSVGGDSNSTMNRVLNASIDFYGNLRRGVSGDGIVQNLLRSYGYDTYGIFGSDYFFWGIGSSYDFSFPETISLKASSPHDLLVKAIFMGEFRFDVGFDRVAHEQFVEHKLSVFESTPGKPRFVYMHSMLPMHSQNSGTCLPNETELFERRLIKANHEMKQDIETIIRNDPGAIVVVAGDHGPYLTKNCYTTGGHYDISEISRLDIQDRFGTFLAIKWPAEDFSEYDDITVLQDIFPAMFAYLFQDDRLLEAKVTPTTLEAGRISGASVKNGIIYGGINDGEPLFVDQR